MEYEIKSYNEEPKKSDMYLCLSNYKYDNKSHTCLEMLRYEVGEGWHSGGYYFEDNFGVSLFWVDINVKLSLEKATPVYGFSEDALNQYLNKL